jgi:hypothetical protein
MSWHPDLPAVALILVLIIGMYAVPSIISGVRTYREGRDLARQLYRERDKPRLFDQDRDVWQ